MESAQGIVKNVDAKDLGSVETSLGAVNGALEACRIANRTTEVEELTKARNELSAHVDYMKRKAAEPPKKKLTKEEIAVLIQHGDPDCPKGQAYLDRDTHKEIKCTGAEPADMTYSQASDYFKARNFKMTPSESPPTLRAEFGAELFVFTYTTPNDSHPPKCVAYYPPPGIGWLEAVSRLTGVPPKKLDKTGTVTTASGPRPLRVDESETKLVVYVGDCG